MNKYFLFLAIIILSSCDKRGKTSASSDLIIESVEVFDSIPSGSGMALMGDSLYIISDDAPSVFLLSLKDKRTKKISIEGLDSTKYRISKDDKIDLECATVGKIYGQQSLIAFGSGSKSPLRDRLMILNASGQVNASLKDFYAYLRKKTNTSIEAWNIEGAGVVGDSLVLLNRGNNMVITISWESMNGYLTGYLNYLPGVNFYKQTMPKINGYEARLSGICQLDKETAIVCASVENTPDWFSDGPVEGSFICLLDVKKRELLSQHLLKDSSGNALKEKIESVELLKKNEDGSISILAITDNDDGKTKMFRLKVK